MPTYYFNLTRCQVPEYRELRREYPNLETALADAQSTARRVRGQLRQLGSEATRSSLDIENDQHIPVARIMLANV
jgi:hypothetical protein